MTGFMLFSQGAVRIADAGEASLLGSEARRFTVDLSGYLSRYDVVYLCPARAPDEGLPLGNGDLCVAVWNADTLNFTLGKSDVWTADPSVPRTVAEYRELFATHRERLQQLQHNPAMNRRDLRDGHRSPHRPPRQTQARIRGTNPYTLAEIAVRVGKRSDSDDFGERLDLFIGTVRCRSARLEADVYVDEGRGLVVSRIAGASERRPREVELWHWDEQEFGAGDGMVWLQHRFEDESGYAIVVGPDLTEARGAVTEPGHRAKLELGPGAEFHLYFAVVTTFESDDPLAAAKELLRRAKEEAPSARKQRHDDWWRRFWTRSYVDFSDRYAANLWYLFLYQMGCSSRGTYPPRFEAGYWGARGFIQWGGGYWQYNEQMLYWPLDAANHPELMEPYMRLIRDVLPAARMQTQAQFGLPGAQYSHCMTVAGQPFQGPGDMIKYVLSTGGLYALYMWQHYEYTGDLQFLRQQAYPVMREVLTFLHGYVEHQVDERGRYVIYPSHPIEDSATFVANPQIDIAILRRLTDAVMGAEELLGAVANPLTPLCRAMKPRIPSCPEADGKFTMCEEYGDTATFEIKPDGPEEAWDLLPSWCEFPGGWKGVPGGRPANNMGTILAAVYPVPEIGLESDPALLAKARATFEAAMKGAWAHGMAFSPSLIIAARLGLYEVVLPGLTEFVHNGQIGPQGWMSYMGYGGGRAGIDRQRMARGADFDILEQPRYQPYFEPFGDLATSITTMLLDSLGGVIHVFPGYPRQGDARFCLRAVGGFIVNGDMRGGEIAYVGLASERGEPCSIANPWPGKEARVVEAKSGRIVLPPTAEAVLRFPTAKGGSYFVERPDRPAAAFPMTPVSGERQEGPRINGPVMIGMPREGWPRYSGPTPSQIRAATIRERQEQLWPPGVPNLAAARRGAKAWVLNPHLHPGRHHPDYLNDGQYGNDRSAISGGDDHVKGIFRVDLGRAVSVCSVSWSRDRTAISGVRGYTDRTPTHYRIEVSLDGQDWKTVREVTDNAVSWGRRDEFAAVQARYVQVVVLKTNGLPPCLDELEVFPR